MDIEHILRSPEGKTLEFKRDLSSHGPILRTLCAFANTAGGTLLFGVADDRSILGVPDPLSAEERLASIVADGITPHVLPEIEVHAWRSTSLLAVTVHPGPSRPYRLRSGTDGREVFVRVGSTNRAADPALIDELGRSARRSSFDEEPFLAAGAALDTGDLAHHLTGGARLSVAELRSLRLTTEYQGRTVPTVGGMLLAGREREAHFPDARMRVAKFAGQTRATILDTRDFEGGLVDIAARTLEWIDDRTLRPVTIGSLRHVARPQFPPAAIREAVINAIVHADYSRSGSPLRVALFEDRIEIDNPGMLPFGMTLAELPTGVSQIRNRVIARVFLKLGLIEQWGSGVPRMIEACRDAGLPLPCFEEKGFGFRVTLYCDERGTASVDPLDARILESLESSGHLRTADLARAIDRTPRATRTRLQRLVDQGLVVQIGSGPTDPNRAYHIAEERTEYRVRRD